MRLARGQPAADRLPMTSFLRRLRPTSGSRHPGAASWLAVLGVALGVALCAPAAAQSNLNASMLFAPTAIASGKPTLLRVRLGNSNSDAQIAGIAYDVPFPAGMRLVGTLDASQCGGTITPVDGGYRFRDGSLGLGSACLVDTEVTVDSDVNAIVTLTVGPITSRNGGSVGSISAALTVQGGIAPAITSLPLPTPGFLGLDYAHQVTVTGTAPVVVTAEGLPPGLVYDPATRRISGRPTLVGFYTVTLRAINGFAPPAAQVSIVEVRNPALQIITPPPLVPDRLLVGAPIALLIEATGGLKPYIFEIVGGALPPGLTLATDGRIVGSPTTAGVYPFTVRVRDVLFQQDARTFELVVGGIATTLAVGLAPNPAVAGQEVVLNATVVAESGAPPAGTLEAWVAGPGTRCPAPFEGGADPVTTYSRTAAVAGGVAQIAFADLAIGHFRVCARFAGTPLHLPSTFGPVDLFVIKGILLQAPKLTLKAPSRANPGATVQGSVVVEAEGSPATPGGTVRVRAGARDVGEIPIVNGRAPFSVAAPVEPGVMTLTASYAGDPAFAPATSAPVYVTVAKANGDGEPIPTLGEAASALLALLLAALAAARLRRRG
ncbi:hypothetical protein BURK1_00202 [Burkholderiales bacterium]|nr:hypothetical protein BURK1_00202 [Burkholderiales bacterium]